MDTTLPTHPQTGLLAVGWRKARPGEEDRLHPIWPVLGGSGDDEPGADGGDPAPGDDDPSGEPGEGDDREGPDDGDDEGDPEGADDLGDKGKRALASMKGKWRSERDKRRALEQQLAEKADGDEKAKERREAESAALSKANARIVRAEVKAAAAGKLADPADAYRFLDLDAFEVDDDGNVDQDEVAEAIEDLVKSKPYLAATATKRFQGTGDGGARKAGRPKQLTRADLKDMTPAQIVKAKAEGRLDDALGLTG